MEKLKTKEESDIVIYSNGLVFCSVCCHQDFTIEEITLWVNLTNETGTVNGWEHSKRKNFKQGNTNPCQCNTMSNHKHYLFEC